MSESVAISPNFVGNEEDLKKEEIFKDFDINYVPLNNLPVNYFPLNNPVLSKELKTIDMTSVSNPIRTFDFEPPEYNSVYNFIKIQSGNIQFEVNESFNCELLLVGGGGGGGKDGQGGGGGGGGQIIYFQDYKLSKGTYTVQIGSSGAGATVNNGTDGGESKLIKDNKDLFVAKGGKGAKGINGGGIDGENINGIGGNGGASSSRGSGGKEFTIEGRLIKYGNGGDGNSPETREENTGNGGNGSSTSGDGFNGKLGVFVIRLKNSSDIQKIKKLSLSLLIIDISNSTGINIEDAVVDNEDNTKKLLKYTTVGNANRLVLNTDLYCDILLVGGGGRGGRYGGGGGGGGFLEVFNFKLNAGTYIINVGDGGNIINGGFGDNTTITKDNQIILGAGGGGLGGGTGDTGGNGKVIQGNSGSGGGRRLIGTFGSGNSIGGNGGDSWKADGEDSGYFGGGGGAGENGKNGTKLKSGDGGIGKLSKITNNYYGGGGGGAGGYGNSKEKSGLGGQGGGGTGEYLLSQSDNIARGIANFGGGGGGGYDDNRLFGGSGIVIIRVHKEALENLGNKEILMQLTNRDTKVLNKIKEEFKKKLKDLDNNQKPFNYFNIFPLVILIIIIWIFIILFLLKLLHHFFANVYIYILLTIIIFILLFGSLWFLYTNNDLL
jgi:hypothetical protein